MIGTAQMLEELKLAVNDLAFAFSPGFGHNSPPLADAG